MSGDVVRSAAAPWDMLPLTDYGHASKNDPGGIRGRPTIGAWPAAAVVGSKASAACGGKHRGALIGCGRAENIIDKSEAYGAGRIAEIMARRHHLCQWPAVKLCCCSYVGTEPRPFRLRARNRREAADAPGG